MRADIAKEELVKELKTLRCFRLRGKLTIATERVGETMIEEHQGRFGKTFAHSGGWRSF